MLLFCASFVLVTLAAIVFGRLGLNEFWCPSGIGGVRDGHLQRKLSRGFDGLRGSSEVLRLN